MKKLLNNFLPIIIFTGCTTVNHPDLDNAKEALNNGFYQTAIHYANQEIIVDPYNADAFLISGKAYSRLNEKEKAFENFNKAVNLSPGDETYFSRGLEHLKNNALTEAVHDFNKSISYNNTNREVLFTRAYTKSLMEDFEGAIEDYKKTIELDPSYFAAYTNLGNIYGRLGYEQEALACFSMAIGIQPNNPDGYFNRGNQKLIMNDLSGGIEDLEKSLMIDDKNISALFLLSELKIKANDNLGSFEVLNRILSLEESPKALYLRGTIYLKLEDKLKACNDFNRAGELGYYDAYEMINKYCVKSKKKK